MVSIIEELKDLQVHVLKWNEQLHNIEESQGLFMFRTNDGVSEICQRFSVSLFDHECLSTPDSREYLVSEAINGRSFYCDETTVRVIKEVSDYLLSCFEFDIQTLHQKPTIVIVVDVYVSTTMAYTRKRVAPSPLPWRKRIKIQKAVDDDDDDKGVKCRMHSEYGPAKLSVQDVQDIRVVLMCFLQEPILMWVKPVVSHQRQGLHQVKAATKVKLFDGDDEAVDDCSICLEGICGETMVAKTPCSHVFHRDCLFKWLSKTNRCPFCRSFCSTLV